MEKHLPVDVIVRRWQEWTGMQATREADGEKFDQIEIVAGRGSVSDQSAGGPSSNAP